MRKEQIADYIEKGFYVGIAGIVGASVAVAAPEIAVAGVVCVVAYRGIGRITDTYEDIKAGIAVARAAKEQSK